MGWTVLLKNESNETLSLDTMLAEQGATACVGEAFLCEMDVTFNHKKFFVETLGEKGLHELDGKKAGDCTAMLSVAVLLLGCKAGKSFWEQTSENAGWFLNVLLNWSTDKQEGFFRVLG